MTSGIQIVCWQKLDGKEKNGCQDDKGDLWIWIHTLISELPCEAQEISSSTKLGTNKGAGLLFYSVLKEAYSAYVPFLSGLEVAMRKRQPVQN